MAQDDEQSVSALDFNIAPYYDDFDDKKKFVKTLFKPGVSVQARELTQLQSSLQHQIGSLAGGTFKEGSVVVPGQMAYDIDYSYVKLQPSYNGQVVNPHNFVGKVIQGKTTGLRALVIYGTIATENDSITLFLKYLDGGKETEESHPDFVLPVDPQQENDLGNHLESDDIASIVNNYSGALGQETNFVKDELLISDFVEGEPPLVCKTIDNIDETVLATGNGSAAYIEEGIYFVRGFLVNVDKQFIVLDKYSKTPSFRIGLEVIEDIVTTEDDASLYDNAAGSANFNASGADRHRISLVLTKREIDSIDDEDFIELLRLVDGEPVFHVRADINQVLEDTLARRTFDESGDYIIDPFSIDMRCFLDEDENRGIYQMSEFAFDTQIEAFDVAATRFGLKNAEGQGVSHNPTLTDVAKYPEQDLDVNKHYPGADHDSFVYKLRELLCVGMEEGKAYVRGYEIEKLGTEYLDYWKSRSFSFNQDSIIDASVGNYIFTTELIGLPSVWDVIELKDYNDVTIGTAKIKSIELNSVKGAALSVKSIWKLYLLDIEMSSDTSIDNVRSWKVEHGTTTVSGDLLTQYYILSPKELKNSLAMQESVYLNNSGTSTSQFYNYDSVNQEILLKHTSDPTTTNLYSAGDTIYFGSAYNVSQKTAIIEKKNQTIDSSNTYMLFPFPYTDIKTIKDGTGLYDAEFYIRKTFIITPNGQGNHIASIGSNEEFVPFNSIDYSACADGNPGTGSTDTNLITLDGDYVTMVIDSGTITITLTNQHAHYGDNIRLTATVKVHDSAANERKKTLANAVITPYTNQDYSGNFLPYATELSGNDAFYPEAWPGAVPEEDKKPDLSYMTLDHCDIFDVIIYDTCDISNGITDEEGVGYQENDGGNRLALHNLTYNGAKYAAEQFKLYQKDETYLQPLTETIPVQLEDITDRYIIDNGQRNGLYELGSVKLKNNKKRPAGRILIAYRYFEHSSSGDCFTVDSYVHEDGIQWEDIPMYNAINMALSDVVDFRPTTSSFYDITTAAAVGVSRETRLLTIFNKSENGDLLTGSIKPNSEIRMDFQYYLNRIDKTYLTKEGDFKIKYGTPALIPEIPIDPDDGMVLYTLNAPAYTRGCDTVDADIQDNRRYTMRDIGKLENRIENIEYYTSLTMLEKETENMSLTDKSGLERFKNGFVVDSFTGHNVGDVEHEDYSCAIDAEEGILRPEFNETNVPIDFSEEHSTGVIRVGDYVMLPYTHKTFAKQDFASQYMNVNPFAIFSFNGDVNLHPSTDNWRDTKRAPALIINRKGNYDSIRRNLIKRGVLGTVWNNWKTDWVGVSRTTTSKRNITFAARDAVRNGIIAQPWWPRPWGARGRATQTIRTVTTTKRSTRRGIRTRIVPYVTRQNIGDRVVNTTMIPFMRSKEIMFVATGMKPDTKIYPVFDNKLVSDYTRPSAKLVITIEPGVILKNNQILANWAGTSEVRIRAVTRNKDGKYTAHVTAHKYKTIFSAGDILKIKGGTSKIATVVSFVNVSTKGTPLFTDDKGTCVGLFRIPNTNKLRFRTGKREFKLSDSPNPRNLDTDTKAEATYTAKGVLTTKQATIISTRHAKVVRESVSRNRTLSKTTRRIVSTELKGWYDPLAQTFMVTQKGGLFLTKIDLFFAKKDKNIPVSLQIRETENGYPGKKILPGGELSIKPEMVNVPSNPDFDASIPTTFEFEEPIFLKELTEYCFVVMSNCQGYEMFVSHLGEKNIGTNRTISSQPYAGVFFKSQNASTWTADQYKDLKFNLYRAKFDIKGGAQAVLNNSHEDENGNNLDLDFLTENCFETTEGLNSIIVYHSDHGFLVDDKVFFQGIEERIYNGINPVFFTDSSGVPVKHIISEVINVDSYKIEITDAISQITGSISSGLFGIGDISATSNFSCDLLLPSIQELDLPGTSMSWKYRAMSGRNIHGNFSPYQIDNKYNSFIMNENIEFDTPKLIASYDNEQRHLGVGSELNKSSLVFKCDMSSESDNLSPLIDLTRSTATVIANRTNNPVENASEPFTGYVENFISETSPEGGSVSSKYVLKEVELNDSSNGLSIITTVHRPYSANVDIYYKIKIAEAKGSINDLDWILTDRPSNYSLSASSSDQYDEYRIEVNDLPEFTSFTIKIVMSTTNSARVPKVKDLRVIALGT